MSSYPQDRRPFGVPLHQTYAPLPALKTNNREGMNVLYYTETDLFAFADATYSLRMRLSRKQTSDLFFGGATVLIPLADIVHVVICSTGVQIISKHSTFNFEGEEYNNSAFVPFEEQDAFLAKWAEYRAKKEYGGASVSGLTALARAAGATVLDAESKVTMREPGSILFTAAEWVKFSNSVRKV